MWPFTRESSVCLFELPVHTCNFPACLWAADLWVLAVTAEFPERQPSSVDLLYFGQQWDWMWVYQRIKAIIQSQGFLLTLTLPPEPSLPGTNPQWITRSGVMWTRASRGKPSPGVQHRHHPSFIVSFHRADGASKSRTSTERKSMKLY